MSHPRRSRLLAAIPAAFLAVSLVGCGNLIENAAENAAEEEGVDLDIDGTDVRVDTTDGGFTTGELPQGYPSDEVPIVDGEILAGTYTKDPDSWNVTVQVDEAGGDKAAAYDGAESTLLDAGLETTSAKTDNGTSISGIYTSASYTVNLAVTDSSGIVVNYTVSPK